MGRYKCEVPLPTPQPRGGSSKGSSSKSGSSNSSSAGAIGNSSRLHQCLFALGAFATVRLLWNVFLVPPDDGSPEPPRLVKLEPVAPLEEEESSEPETTSDWRDWKPLWNGSVDEDSRGLASQVWRELQNVERPTAVQTAKRLLSASSSMNHSLSLIEIGGCDGDWAKTNDPVQELLRNENVRAMVLEPVPKLWKELSERLNKLHGADRRLLALNAALCMKPGAAVPFYVVSPQFAVDYPDSEHWVLRELGSFNRKHLRRHHIPNKYIEKIDVPCVAPQQLFEQPRSPVGHDASAVDVFVVDAEGLDGQLVLSTLAIKIFRPALVIFEQKHIPRKELEGVLATLRKLHYVHWRDGDQMVALLSARSGNPNDEAQQQQQQQQQQQKAKVSEPVDYIGR